MATTSPGGGIRHTVPMAPPFRRALRLRTRVTLFFSLTALVASLALALVTYALARSFLTSQRESVARTQAFSNASGFKALLQSVPESTSEQITIQMRSVPTESSGFAMLEIPSASGERQFLSDQNYPEDAFPGSLREMVAGEQSGQQRFSLDGEPYVAVGVYIRSADARYLEAFPLTDTNRTLRYLATAMAIGAGVTTLLAAGLGWWTSRRLLRPLSRVSTAASEIAVRRARRPDAARGRPRPRPAGQLVQRDGRRGADAHRARGPLRLRRVPRAALADHRARRGGRGARQPAQRPARAQPAGARRRRRPGPALRSDGHGPARAVAHRRRLDGAAPRADRSVRADLAASPTAMGSARSRSTSTRAWPAR